jgi:signal transduction histidine kinase
MFQSAVFKLTAAYVAIAMSICIVCSIVLYHVAVNELNIGFQNEYQRWHSAFEPFGLRNPGGPAQELATRTQHIASQIFWFNVLVFAVTSVASYIIAKRTLRPLETAHELQKRFTADVSHELRTPLTAIRMESEVSLINSKSTPKELRASLESNLEEVSHMETLINNLLQLSTIEASEQRMDFSRVDLKAVVSEAAGIATKSGTKKVRIKKKLTEAYVMGDKPNLTQLFVILIENAIKYSPPDSAVDVSIRKGRGRVVVEITDKGIGIPADAIPHIFDRFYRADSSRTRKPGAGDSESSKGFGLGLSIAKLIADVHNAEIVISSSEGKGTTASVRMNLV